MLETSLHRESVVKVQGQKFNITITLALAEHKPRIAGINQRCRAEAQKSVNAYRDRSVAGGAGEAVTTQGKWA